MRVRIVASGRMRQGPEQALTSKYLARFNRAGRGVGLGPCEVIEISSGKKGKRPFQPTGPVWRTCLLDERGIEQSSKEFSRMLASWRDEGIGTLDFLIGGPGGIDPGHAENADMVLSFGRMVFPHMLIRAMLAEQLYRSVSILSGTPYHRE